MPCIVCPRYGELGDVYMPRDLRSGEPRGFAFVRYMDQRDADDAIDRLDGEFFAGRELRIQVYLLCPFLFTSCLGKVIFVMVYSQYLWNVFPPDIPLFLHSSDLGR